MENKIETKRFYKMDKALQLVEGTTVAALWAHLIDAYNYFKQNDKVTIDNTIFQAAKVTQAFTGIGPKAQSTARERLVELGFLKYTVAAIPGHATKTTHYMLFPDVYEKWSKEHNYDELRDQKYKELQPASEHGKLEQWLNENMTDAQKQTLDRMNQKQKSVGTFANHTEGHLQTSPGTISKVPEEAVIDTKVIDTKEVENTQKKEGCVYSGKDYPYLIGKTKSELFKYLIDEYRSKMAQYNPSITSIEEFDMDRYFGDLEKTEKEFMKFDIEVAANFYVGILGYLNNMERQIYGNPGIFKAAHKLENLLRYKRDVILTETNIFYGEPSARLLHSPKCTVSL